MILSRLVPAVRRLGSACLYWSGGSFLYRRTLLGNRITVVFYHDIVERSLLPEMQLFVEEKFFWSHIEILARDYRIIGMSDLLTGTSLPPRPLVLTFDGYARNFLGLARRLSERRIPALFYLMTEPSVTGRPHWHQRLFFTIRNAKPQFLELELNGDRFSFSLTGKPREYLSVAFRLVDLIEKSDEKHGLVELIASKCGSPLETFDAASRPLTPDDIRDMASLPGIEIGSHSHTHPRHPDPETARFELQESKKNLEGWTGRPVVHYAYPEGRQNEAALKLLPELGYRTAAVTGGRTLDAHSSAEWPWAIPRFMLGNAPCSVMAGRLTGWERILDAMIARRQGRRI